MLQFVYRVKKESEGNPFLVVVVLANKGKCQEQSMADGLMDGE
jgi:hypothetical protein